ncbi:MAG: M48 family metalloprotease [Armatimonadetes bacterium]|nr:M48 family metalloprotease [Armatimonadota bacterium]MDI9584867.1 M48 family metalloprotease [Acidobacteriota bacterium]
MAIPMRTTPMLIAGLMVLVLTGCNDGGTFLMSMNDEIKLGQNAADEFERENPVLRSGTQVNLVKSVGDRIAAQAVPPRYPYDFRVIDSDTVNAVAFLGGRIYFYRGLLDAVNNDPDMIAWVMGHEVTHVAFRHSAKRIEQQLGVDLLTQVLLGKSDAAQIAGAVSGLMFLDYGRDKELQADHQGLKYSAKAGYDPTAAIAVIRVFQSLHGQTDPSKLELLFMTHPGDNTRINQVKRLCDKYGYTGKYYP